MRQNHAHRILITGGRVERGRSRLNFPSVGLENGLHIKESMTHRLSLGTRNGLNRHISTMAADGVRAEVGAEHVERFDTIILGAGMAGLACASRLLQANHTAGDVSRLRVLEARTRMGGRIASVQVQGCRLDCGANWIHGTGNIQKPNPLMAILPHKRYKTVQGSVLFQAPNAEPAVTENDSLFEKEMPSTGDSLLIPTELAEMIVSGGQNAIGAMQDLAGGTPAAEAKNVTVLRALVNTQAFHDAFALVPEDFHRTLGALFQSIESMEAAPLLAQTTEPDRPESEPGVGLLEYAVDEYDGEQAFLQDGYTEVIDEIAKPLVEAGIIALETIVTRIDWTNNPIVVETNRGSYAAREVVCTFPLGVLKDHLKDALLIPELPADKQEAINSIGFGTLDKIFAVYSTPWWNDEPYRSTLQMGHVRAEAQQEDNMPDLFLGFTSELSGISVGRDGDVSPDAYRLPILNLHSLTGQPVLGAFVSCKMASTVEGMKDEDISGLFHRTLTQWFGIEPPKADAVHITRWAQDPYSKGAYSHMVTGLSEPEHRESLQKPVVNEFGGVLRFAGEHCSRDYFAMVHGALLDGWRVADALLQQSEMKLTHSPKLRVLEILYAVARYFNFRPP